MSWGSIPLPGLAAPPCDPSRMVAAKQTPPLQDMPCMAPGTRHQCQGSPSSPTDTHRLHGCFPCHGTAITGCSRDGPIPAPGAAITAGRGWRCLCGRQAGCEAAGVSPAPSPMAFKALKEMKSSESKLPALHLRSEPSHDCSTSTLTHGRKGRFEQLWLPLPRQL